MIKQAMSVGAAILSRRLDQGVTQRTLAGRAMVTPANLSAIESGRRDLTVGTLLRLARALKVPPGSLFGGPPRRPELPHDTFNRAARAVLTGARPFGTDLNLLVDAVAWNCRPILETVGAAGRHRGSRRAARLAGLRWSREQIRWLEQRVRKLAAGGQARGA